MRFSQGRIVLATALLALAGCVPHQPEPVVQTPVPEVKKALLAVTVLSTPSQATVSLHDQPIGLTPQSISLDSASELLQLKAALAGDVATEKRIRFLSPERVEVHFLFSKDRSPLAKSLGLSKVLVFEYGDGITFDVDRHELRPGFTDLLARQAEMLQAHFSGLDIYVCGHTDSSGNTNHNLTLSLERAETVASFLASKGIPWSRMKVQGFGSAFPVASNETAEGKALNRRTEIVLPQ
jgi:outer membrane protein OmpA-like peptidoglycan-associated protein